MKYIVLGPMCWGTGKTITEARKNAKANWPKSLMSPAKWRESIYQAGDEAVVDDLGNICGKDIRNTVKRLDADTVDRTEAREYLNALNGVMRKALK